MPIRKNGTRQMAQLARRFRALEDGLHACEAELSKVQAQGESEVHLQNALHIIAALRDQEEQ